MTVFGEGRVETSILPSPVLRNQSTAEEYLIVLRVSAQSADLSGIYSHAPST